MTTASRVDAGAWMEQGTALVSDALAGLDEAAFEAPTALPGWTRKHLVAHLAANAEAIGNLVRWAATGTETPMYASAEERDVRHRGAAAAAPARELTEWFDRSAASLGAAMDALTEEQWETPVVTAQGRTVPANETPVDAHPRGDGARRRPRHRRHLRRPARRLPPCPLRRHRSPPRPAPPAPPHPALPSSSRPPTRMPGG